MQNTFNKIIIYPTNDQVTFPQLCNFMTSHHVVGDQYFEAVKQFCIFVTIILSTIMMLLHTVTVKMYNIKTINLCKESTTD